MEAKEGNEPAYPVGDTIHPETGERCDPLNLGLTKRELIAAMAMQGLLQNEDYTENDLTREACASDAVKLADELLKQLSNGN